MEILSDATFRGATTFKKDVSIDGGNFSVTLPGSSDPSIRTNYKTDGAVYNFVVIGSEFVLDDFTVGNGTAYFKGQGGIKVTNDAVITGGANIRGGANINGGTTIYNSLNLSGFNKINTNGKSITFPSKAGTLALTSDIPSVPSDVARVKSLPIDFDVAADCTRFYVPGANGANVYSLQMFKWNDSDGVCGYYLKNVDLAVVSDSNIPGSFVVVEKSSSFAISASDNYSIKIVY